MKHGMMMVVMRGGRGTRPRLGRLVAAGPGSLHSRTAEVRRGMMMMVMRGGRGTRPRLGRLVSVTTEVMIDVMRDGKIAAPGGLLPAQSAPRRAFDLALQGALLALFIRAAIKRTSCLIDMSSGGVYGQIELSRDQLVTARASVALTLPH